LPGPDATDGFREIKSARLTFGRGLMNGRLRVVLTDGTRTKLLWLKDDTVHDVLRSTLEEWLGNRLTVQ
jgi:hypothetical protein